MQIARIPETTQPIDAESAAVLEWLTAGLIDPYTSHGLVSAEFGGEQDGGPSVLAECLGANRYLVARHVELDTRTEDPEVNDRAVAPQVEFIRQGGNWFAVAAERGHWGGDHRDPTELAVALLRTVAREQSIRPARGLLGRLTLYMWKRSRTRMTLGRRA